MCFSQPKAPSPPKPPPLQQVAPPAPPPAPAAAPKPVQAADAKPDLRIGSQKSSSASRSKVSGSSLKSSLNMGGNNQGLNL